MNTNTTRCHDCKRVLAPGESAWADEWLVVEPAGTRAETRYHCDECESDS